MSDSGAAIGRVRSDAGDARAGATDGPQPGRTVVFSPPPTPNGPLHVGHLSGPYVAGDIAVRAARAEGADVVAVCGLDSHQNYVLARAEADRRTPAETIAHYGGLVRTALAAARIGYDVFFEPYADTDYQKGVVAVLDDLVSTGAIDVAETTLMACAACGRTLHHVRVGGRCPVCGEAAGGGTCEGCGSFVTAATLLEARSSCCQALPMPIRCTVPVLRLEQYRAELIEIWAGAQIPPRVRALLAGYVAHGLPDVPVAYSTDWGIAWTHAAVGAAPLRIDVWAEMAFGYLFGIARHLSGSAPSGVAECLAGWADVSRVWHFFGVDNAFYYTVMIPAILTAAGLPARLFEGVVVNEFYRLDGRKFSTSRNHAIWAHDFLAAEDPGLVRAFVAWDRPDRRSTDFTRERYAAFVERYAAVLADSGRTADDADPGPLVPADSTRAGDAVRLESFDVALAVRCVLAARAAGPGSATPAWKAVTGIA